MSLVRFRPEAPFADLAHLVERDLAKVEVAGSSPVIRSKKRNDVLTASFLFLCDSGLEGETVLNDSLNGCQIRGRPSA